MMDSNTASAIVVLAEAINVMTRLEEADLGDLDDTAPLPAGIMTVGEALRIIPCYVTFMHNARPDLWEPGAMEVAMREANFIVGTRPSATLN